METNARRVDLDGVEHHDVELSDVRLHVVTAGTGSPVLLLHGFPQSWWEYHDVIGPLAEHHRVICPDLRGSGESDAPPTGYDVATVHRELLELLDHFDAGRAGIIAHDWAAMASFPLALSHPDRVAWLMSLAVPHPWTHMSPRMMWGFRLSWHIPLILTPGLGPWLLGAGDQRFLKRTWRVFMADPSAWTDEVVEPYLAPLREPARQRAGRLRYTQLIMPVSKDTIGGRWARDVMPCPVLCLAGAQDPIVRADYLRGPAAEAAGVAVEEVPRAGHCIPEERPDVVVARALALGAGEWPVAS